MDIVIARDSEEASKLAARYVMVNAKPGMRLGVATGSTPLGLYKNLREAHAAGDFSLEESQAFALDEYVGVAEDHPERYRNVLRAELVGPDKTGLTDENLHTPDGLAEDLEAAAAAYEEVVSPGVDLQILGLGSDGHIGFNEPAGSLDSLTHVGFLTEETRRDNARFFDGDIDQVPTNCITQGLSTIMSASKVMLLAFGEGKADAVAQLIEGGVSAFWPATILQHHRDALIILDEQAASKLKLTSYYKQMAEHFTW